MPPTPRPWRRLRGAVLRAARSRLAALAIGFLLGVPGAALTFGALPRLPAWTAGLGLILLATGASFILIAIMGRRPDWMEDED